MENVSILGPRGEVHKVTFSHLFLTVGPFGPQGLPGHPPGDSQDAFLVILGRFGSHSVLILVFRGPFFAGLGPKRGGGVWAQPTGYM